MNAKGRRPHHHDALTATTSTPSLEARPSLKRANRISSFFLSPPPSTPSSSSSSENKRRKSLRRLSDITGSAAQSIRALLSPPLNGHGPPSFSAYQNQRSDLRRAHSVSNPPSHSHTHHSRISMAAPPTAPTHDADPFDPNFTVPRELRLGTPMLKVSQKNNSKVKQLIFTLDPDRGCIAWPSKKASGGKILIENIRELRPKSSARTYRLALNLASDLEDRWLTIIYLIPPPSSSGTTTSSSSAYKILHIIALTPDSFSQWYDTLSRLVNTRKELMNGLGRVEERNLLWEKGMWRNADVGVNVKGESNGLLGKLGVGDEGSTQGKGDEKLSFEEVEKMCMRLGVRMSRDDLKGLFSRADSESTGFLDFIHFQSFVRELKRRPEISRLWRRYCRSPSTLSPTSATPPTEPPPPHPTESEPVLIFENFKRFIYDIQKEGWTSDELEKVWRRWAILPPSIAASSPSSTAPPSLPSADSLILPLEQFTSFLLSASNSVAGDPVPPDAYTSNEDALIPPKAVKKSEAETYKEVNDNTGGGGGGGYPHPMNYPLSSYYISTSHNTYLIGRQLVGASTIEGYVRALLASCRSVELDIYDGPTEPVITHGKTLTSSITLRSVCQAISKYAFASSPWPIIISAEVHCGLEGQDEIVKIMKECFGDALVRAELKDGEFVIVGSEAFTAAAAGATTSKETSSTAEVEANPNITIEGGVEGSVVKVDVLPSPEQLRGRVLLKAKNLYVSPTQPLKEKDLTVDTESTITTTTAESASDGELVKDIKSELGKARQLVQKVAMKRHRSRSRSQSRERRGVEASAAADGSTSASGADEPPNSSGGKQKVKMSLALVALLVYTVGVKCRGINKKETYAPSHVFSLSERTANKVLKQSMYDLVKHNRTHLVRVYPDGMRIGSTNFEPIRYWAAGCQLVALNWQTFDLGNMINHAMFQRNNKSGYVLKPWTLRSNDKNLLAKRTKHLLRVTVISGQQLPCPANKLDSEKGISGVDPYVEISLHLPDPSTMSPLTPPSGTSTSSPPSLSKTLTAKTSVVKNNGFNPVWEETLLLPFEVIGDMKELVFVRFEVKDDKLGDDGGMGVYCASLGCMRQGYRHVPLHDSQFSQYLFSTLFVKIELEDVKA